MPIDRAFFWRNTKLLIWLIALCLVCATTPVVAQPIPPIERDMLAKHVLQILTVHAPGRVEKWMRPLTFAIAADKEARDLWVPPFLLYCESLHLKWQGLDVDQIDRADVEVYVVDDMASALERLKPMINREKGYSDEKYAEWARKIEITAKGEGASYQTFLSDNASLQRVGIVIPTSLAKSGAGKEAISRLVLRALSRAGDSDQPVPSLLSTQPAADPYWNGRRAGNASLLDSAFLSALYSSEIPYRAPATEVVPKLVNIMEATISRLRAKANPQ